MSGLAYFKRLGPSSVNPALFNSLSELPGIATDISSAKISIDTITSNLSALSAEVALKAALADVSQRIANETAFFRSMRRAMFIEGETSGVEFNYEQYGLIPPWTVNTESVYLTNNQPGKEINMVPSVQPSLFLTYSASDPLFYSPSMNIYGVSSTESTSTPKRRMIFTFNESIQQYSLVVGEGASRNNLVGINAFSINGDEVKRAISTLNANNEISTEYVDITDWVLIPAV